MVAAVDEVHHLNRANQGSPLPLRYSYMQLKNAINDVKEAASKDIFVRIPRRKGYSNASLALDTYFHVKENAPSENPTRNELSEYKRISSR